MSGEFPYTKEQKEYFKKHLERQDLLKELAGFCKKTAESIKTAPLPVIKNFLALHRRNFNNKNKGK